MQTARPARQDSSSKSMRSRMLAALNIRWKKLRHDLAGDELHDELIAFINDRLRLKEPISSLRSLSDAQLGRSLDALRDLEAQPALPNSQGVNGQSAEIIHLASAAQVHTINTLLDYLRWSDPARENFIEQRFKRKSPSMLSPKQAHALIMILLNVATARWVKETRGASRVSRLLIREEIPHLKAMLGNDRKEASE